MDIKKVLSNIGIIIFISLLIFGGGYWIGYKQCSMASEDTITELRAGLERTGELYFGIGESISKSLTTIELIEEIERRGKAIEREREEAINSAQRESTAGKELATRVREAQRGITGDLESIGDFIEEIARAFDEYQDSLGRYWNYPSP